MSNVVKLDFDFQLMNKLETLPKRILVESEEEAQQILDTAKTYAQTLCPVATGSLRNSIRLEHGSRTDSGFTLRLRAGGYVINPRTGQMVNYAKFVEDRFGFMKAATTFVRSNILDLIQRVAVEEASK